MRLKVFDFNRLFVMQMSSLTECSFKLVIYISHKESFQLSLLHDHLSDVNIIASKKLQNNLSSASKDQRPEEIFAVWRKFGENDPAKHQFQTKIMQANVIGW